MSTINSETSLVTIKQLFGDQKFDEAYKEIQKGLQLDPNNVKYFIWLARYYSVHAMQTQETGNANQVKSIFQKSLDAATQALRLDSSSSAAYIELAGAYMFLGDMKQAINNANIAIKYGGCNKRAYQMLAGIYFQKEDAQSAIDFFTKALESPAGDDIALVNSEEITNADILLFRSYSYELIGDYKHAIEDRINAYQVTKKSRPEIDPKFQPWADGTYKHFTEKLLPTIKRSEEKLLDYWDCYLSWGADVLRSQSKSGATAGLVGTFGTGYVCLTDKNIHVVSLGELTRKFSPIKKKGGWRNFAEHFVFGHSSLYDLRELEKMDKMWQIPFPSVQGAQIVDTHIELIAPPVKWTFFPGETGQLQVMMAAIHMGYSGELAKMWAAPNANYTFNIARDLNMGDKVEVKLGNNATIYGDFAVANSIKDSFNKATSANIPNDLKKLLKDLSIAVGQMSEKLSQEEAKQAARDLETLMAEATSEKPRRKWWELSIDGLKEAARNVGEIGKPVLELATRIVAILSGLPAN